MSMINKKVIQNGNEGLFSSQIPTRKSFIMTEQAESLNLSGSNSMSIKKISLIPTPSKNSSLRRSSIFITGVSYPGSNFIAKKVKRIIYAHLGRVMQKIKNYRRPIINLNLINQNFKRSLNWSFFLIRIEAQSHKGNELDQVIIRNKRPHLIFYAVGRVVKRNQSQSIHLLKKNDKSRKNIERVILIIDRIFKNSSKQVIKKQFLRNLKQVYAIKCQKIESTKQIFHLLPKITNRIKQQSFRTILLKIKADRLQNIQEQRKNMTVKLNESTIQRARSLTNERQQIRNIKNDLDSSSADRSKTRYEIRKDLNNLKNKLREEEKRSKMVTCELIAQNTDLQKKLSNIRQVNSKRLQRMQSKISQQTVKIQYKIIHQQQANESGQVRIKNLSKQRYNGIQKQLQKLDQFHSYQNQKLRVQVFEYENLLALKNDWPEDTLIKEENACLKLIMQAVLARSLENYANRDNIDRLQQ